MEQVSLTKVPVRVQTKVSRAYVAQLEALATQRIDLRGMLEGALRHGDAWLEREVGPSAEAFGEMYARVRMEAGQVPLLARGAVARVGEPLQTYLVRLEDGKVVEIRGGGGGK